MAHRHDTSAPRLACEILPDRVIAARATENRAKMDMVAARRLPPGAVTPSLSGSNVVHASALREAVENAMQSIAGRAKDMTVVLPDAAARVLLMDFETLPDREADALPLLRFRLRKSLPFDVEKALVSYHAWRSAGNVRVVAAVAPHAVVEEYEQAIRDAGYAPGVVMPSLLASLGVVDSEVPTLVLKLDAETTSMAIVDQDEIRLLRNIDHTGKAITTADLVNDVYPSIVFFEDTYGAQIQRVLLGGSHATSEISAALAGQTEVRVEDLMPAQLSVESLGGDAPRHLLAGVTGALIA